MAHSRQCGLHRCRAHGISLRGGHGHAVAWPCKRPAWNTATQQRGRATRPTRQAQYCRGGFTLAEVLICSVILLLGFMAMMAAFGTASVLVQRGEDTTVATFLADEVRDWALQRPFADVLANNVPFPGIMSTGWSVVVVVTPKLATDLTSDVVVAAAAATAARMTVDVRANGQSVVKQAYYIFKLDPGTFMDG